MIACKCIRFEVSGGFCTLTSSMSSNVMMVKRRFGLSYITEEGGMKGGGRGSSKEGRRKEDKGWKRQGRREGEGGEGGKE